MKKENDIDYTFVNELDNEIDLKLKKTYDENDVKNFHGVNINMKGPKTYIDETFTYKELEELNKSLDKILEDQKNDAKDYNKPRKKSSKRWSTKYKKSINCSNPKGFSQKQYCKRKKRGGNYKKSRFIEIQKFHKIASVPYSEAKSIRRFPESVEQEDLVWHKDKEDRVISVLSGNNWMIQFENKLPKKLAKGKEYFIKKNSWHRILKGSKDLILKINKISSDKNIYSEEEQRDILLANAKSHFGLTEYIEQAGYLLEDGTMLDFSGGSGFDRVVDHRGIEAAFGGKYENFIPNYDRSITSRTDVMNHFMRMTQSIRLMLYDDGIAFDIEADITEAQKHMIEQIIRDIKRFKKLDWVQVMKPGEENRFYDSYEISEAKRYMSGESLFSNSDSFEEMIDKIHSCEERDLEELSKTHDVKIKNIGNDAYELDFSNSYFNFEFRNSRNYSNSKAPHILIFENGDLTNIEEWLDINEEYLDEYDLDEKYNSFLN